ncbi:MAG: iron ABC transporter permease [Pyrinomonadaceae bacterium]|nr:iron ABC transporter permease [Pyrinomonadaceae bacterium]
MKRAAKIAMILIAVLAAAVAAALLFGAEWASPFSQDPGRQAIFFDIRLPRVLLGACVGASLAVAGAALQALLRNPLAEPYLLGVSNGAALGTMLAFVVFGNYVFARPLLAFTGAAAASVLVYSLAKTRAGMNVERLVLSGVIVTTFLSSVIIMLTTLLDAARLRSFTFWLLGDLSQATWSGVYLSFGAAVIATIILSSQSKALNLMMLGERDAVDFGVETGRVRLVVFGASSLVVGAAVAASGSVGYVGLIVPHLLRLAFGSDNRIVVPMSAIAGAAFVVLADLAARVAIAPRELPVGAVTALLGAPLFIYLLRKN